MNVEVSRKAQPNTVGAIGVNAKWSNTLQSSTHSELILSPDVICHVWERGGMSAEELGLVKRLAVVDKWQKGAGRFGRL